MPSGVEVKRALDEVIADGGNVERVIAGRDGGDAKVAGGIRGGAEGGAGKLDDDVGEGFAAAGVDYDAAGLCCSWGWLLGGQDERSQEQERQGYHCG